MAGTAGGVLWGAIWGAVVGGLVLLLAAVLIDLGTDTPPDALGAAAPPAAPDAGPVLLPRMGALAAPSAALPALLRPDPAARGLVPRPAQPVLPQLAVGAGVARPVADLPPVPVMAPAAAPRVSGIGMPPPVDRRGGMSVPPARDNAPDLAVRAAGSPRLTAPAPPSVPPGRPTPPGPLIDMPAPPAIAPPPRPDGTAPATSRPDLAALRSAPPAPAPPVAATPRPQPPGPRVAFVLDAAAPGPLPDWIGGQASETAPGRLVLVGGGTIVTDTGAAQDSALLAYVRLDAPDAADATTLARIALRARRDGAVIVLVSGDPALWDRLGAWLGGPARDLVPVTAASLLD
ncbi:hypothetical protein ACVDG3_02195 [Meridianimarinicoccus sp. RP-17]